MPRLLTRAQFARKTKYSRARITQLVKQGVIILKNGKVDPIQANAAIEANIDRSCQLKAEARAKSIRKPQMEFQGNGFNTERKNGNDSNGFNTDQQTGLPSLTEVRRDHELKKMEKTEIEIEVRRGLLVPKDEGKKMVIALGSAFNLAFKNLPRRLADTLAIMTDPKEIEIFLRSEIKTIFKIMEEARRAKPKHPGPKDTRRRLGKDLQMAR